MKRLIVLAALVAAIAAPQSVAASADRSTTYYLSLGDSLAESFQPNGDLTNGYAEQLYAALVTDDPKLELVSSAAAARAPPRCGSVASRPLS